uniref:Uncharacterized protein n=1 Tax=Aegilops tauschii subsp. strangulata TaxID=200361 RepID=A0A452YC39_AEGTS
RLYIGHRRCERKPAYSRVGAEILSDFALTVCYTRASARRLIRGGVLPSSHPTPAASSGSGSIWRRREGA